MICLSIFSFTVLFTRSARDAYFIYIAIFYMLSSFETILKAVAVSNIFGLFSGNSVFAYLKSSVAVSGLFIFFM